MVGKDNNIPTIHLRFLKKGTPELDKTEDGGGQVGWDASQRQNAWDACKVWGLAQDRGIALTKDGVKRARHVKTELTAAGVIG